MRCSCFILAVAYMGPGEFDRVLLVPAGLGFAFSSRLFPKL